MTHFNDVDVSGNYISGGNGDLWYGMYNYHMTMMLAQSWTLMEHKED